MQMSRLQEYYRENVVPKLNEQFSYKSAMEIPKITKITLNMGVGEDAGANQKHDEFVPGQGSGQALSGNEHDSSLE